MSAAASNSLCLPHRLIDPQALMSIRNLEMRARVVVEGFERHSRSPYHGFSVEFSEYRQYTPGDDPRYLDWRGLLAATATSSRSLRTRPTSVATCSWITAAP
jgi:hypothetical protein